MTAEKPQTIAELAAAFDREAGRVAGEYQEAATPKAEAEARGEIRGWAGAAEMLRALPLPEAPAAPGALTAEERAGIAVQIRDVANTVQPSEGSRLALLLDALPRLLESDAAHVACEAELAAEAQAASDRCAAAVLARMRAESDLADALATLDKIRSLLAKHGLAPPDATG